MDRRCRFLLVLVLCSIVGIVCAKKDKDKKKEKDCRDVCEYVFVKK